VPVALQGPDRHDRLAPGRHPLGGRRLNHTLRIVAVPLLSLHGLLRRP